MSLDLEKTLPPFPCRGDPGHTVLFLCPPRSRYTSKQTKHISCDNPATMSPDLEETLPLPGRGDPGYTFCRPRSRLYLCCRCWTGT